MPAQLSPSAVTSGRSAALDVVRGVAIAGTFGTNVWLVTAAGGAASFSITEAPPGAWATVLRALPNGAFLALLTLLFGIGLELQYRAARRRGLRWPGRYLVRAAILFLEGLLHYVLVFEYDVLMGYAITSVVVAHLVGRSDACRRRWMIGAGSVAVLLVLVLTALLLLAPPVPGPVFSTASWSDQVLRRLADPGLYRSEILIIVPSATVLFLLGSRLLRAGVLAADDAGRRLRRRLMGWGFGVGVPLRVAAITAGSDWYLADRYLVGPLLALGLLALVVGVVVGARRAGVVQGWFAAVGRTALTCYVLQNLVAAVLCYDWGLGLNGRLAGLGVLWPVALWCAVVGADVVLAVLWLRHHDRGPVELLAHRLAGRGVREPLPGRHGGDRSGP